MGNEYELNEKIKVLALFDAGLHPCKPIKFRRSNGQVVEITKVGLIHPSFRGRKTVHIFTVTNGEADYRLEFDSIQLTWLLTWMGDMC